MKDTDPKEIASQLRKPTGEKGIEVGKNMNDSNVKLYDLGLDMMTFGDEDNILEIGFGNGMFISRYFDLVKKAKVYGHDYSPEMCEEAKANNKKWHDENRLNITCGDCLNMDYDSDFFDKIIAINTIYFWEPLKSYLKEIKRVLKPGGQFLIGFRPKNSVEQFEFTKHNFTLYEPEDLTKILEECGLFLIQKESKKYNKKTVTGMEFKAIDICLLCTK